MVRFGCHWNKPRCWFLHRRELVHAVIIWQAIVKTVAVIQARSNHSMHHGLCRSLSKAFSNLVHATIGYITIEVQMWGHSDSKIKVFISLSCYHKIKVHHSKVVILRYLCTRTCICEITASWSIHVYWGYLHYKLVLQWFQIICHSILCC